MKQELKSPSFDYNKVDQLFKEAKTMDDLLKDGGFFQTMMKETTEKMLKAELEEHLGYGPSDARNKNTDNRRNGSSKKTLKTSEGNIEIDVPRDRDGTFEPIALPKGQNLSRKLEEQIISMYGKGMTTRDISEHLREVYMGVEISPTLISKVTDKILEGAKEWQSRLLEGVYPVIFFDAIHFKVRQDGKIISKAAYIALGINIEGKRDVLGIYIGENESASFWLSVMTDLKNRGVQDILIACIDGLKGFPDAIKSIFPKTEIQLCIIHQIRNSLKYINYKNKKEFIKNLKDVYQAPNENVALENLLKMDEIWGKKYPVVINSWKNNWDNLSSFFKYSDEIRKIIYTTNLVEGYNRQLRKVMKNRSIFPTDDSLSKLMYLATKQASKKWTNARKEWPQIISQLAIYFEGRIDLGIL